MTAKIVVFEGADASGKCTQSRLLERALHNDGVSAIRVEPTRESHPRGRKLIYAMLENGDAKRWPTAFQFIQFVNRVYFQVFKLPKLLRDNDVVILDRWALSGYVYGKAEGINPRLNAWMYNRAKRADVVVVLCGASHPRKRADDSYERDNNLQAMVKVLYREAGLHLPGHALVDNHDSVEEVHQSIMALLVNKRILPSTRCPVCDGELLR